MTYERAILERIAQIQGGISRADAGLQVIRNLLALEREQSGPPEADEFAAGNPCPWCGGLLTPVHACPEPDTQGGGAAQATPEGPSHQVSPSGKGAPTPPPSTPGASPSGGAAGGSASCGCYIVVEYPANDNPRFEIRRPCRTHGSPPVPASPGLVEAAEALLRLRFRDRETDDPVSIRSFRDGFDKGFLAGQEAMREKAAALLDDETTGMPLTIAALRALPLAEPPKEGE